jgi:hypothetical protein
MAQKGGWSVAKAERAWDKIKDAVVGAKLKSGATIPASSKTWTDEMWAYVMGSLRNAMQGKKAESMIEAVKQGISPEGVVNNLLEGTTLSEGDLRYNKHKVPIVKETNLKDADVKKALTVVTAINQGMRRPYLVKTIDELFEWLETD